MSKLLYFSVTANLGNPVMKQLQRLREEARYLFVGAVATRESIMGCRTLRRSSRAADFMDYVLTSREVLAAFIFTFCIRLSDAERRIEILANRGAEERLGRLLLHLAASRRENISEPVEMVGEVALPVSHDELAQMAAMSRPHVTHTMGKLRHRRLVRYERGRPLVVDVPALRAYLTGE